MSLIYMDNSATTKPCDKAVDAMVTSLRMDYFNPSALYRQALQAEKILKNTSQKFASLLGTVDKQIIFTSGGTESDNLAVFGNLQKVHGHGEVLYSAAEHAAVKNACLEAQNRFPVTAREIPLTGNGLIDLEALASMLNAETRLICVMHVCNETGVIMPLEQICALRDRLAPKAAIHVDGVQSFLRVPFSFRKYAVQSYALSGHKIHAPKGIGVLALREGYTIHEQIVGGGQQRDMRSGTENTCGIAALSAAVSAYPADGSERMLQVKQVLVASLEKLCPNTRIIGIKPGEEGCSPHVLSVAFPPVRAETLLHALEGRDIIVGTGSACSSKKGKRSAVLNAMKLPNEIMDGAIRISLCPSNTIEEAETVAEEIANQVHFLGRFARR